MRLKSIKQLEYLGVVNYIGFHLWTLARGGIYHGEKCDISAWLWKYFEWFGIQKCWNKMYQKDGYLHSKIHCLTLVLLCTAVLVTIFFRFDSALKLIYFSDFLGFKYACLCL